MRLGDCLKNIPYFSLISNLARRKKTNIWLVGGFLRDIYLKKGEDTDFDFCVESNIIAIVKEFTKKTSSKFIVLDENEKAYRVILKRKGKIYTYDFTLMRGKNFLEDLSSRDFSINTLAVRLDKRRQRLIDYFGGSRDLTRKTIRAIKEEVFLDDPLRILRGFSFMANLTFRIEKKTEEMMVKHKRLLKNVSGERINEELFKILSSPFSFRVIKRMAELRILDEIIPYLFKGRRLQQGPYHHLDVWEHSLESLRKFELFYQRKLIKNREIFDYLNEELAQGRKRIQICKLACLLHDIGKPFARKRLNKKTIFHTHEKIGRDLSEEIGSKLRLSFREKEVLKKLVYWHLRPGYLADQTVPTKRAIYRFFRDTESEGPAVIVVSLSDWRATRGPLTNAKMRRRHEQIMLKLVDYYFQKKKEKPLPKIVDGYDIMKRFNLTPSPLIGKILKKIKEEQVLGRICTKKEAYEIVKTCKWLREGGRSEN